MENMEVNLIYLRELRLTDWIDVHAYASQERVCLFQPWGPNTYEQTQIFVNQIIEDAQGAPRTRYAYAIIEQNINKMIGMIEINIRSTIDRSGEISYIIHPDYWGKGIATDASSLLLEVGFEKFDLHRIYATCDPRNLGSSRVLLKIGMTYEGRLRDALLIKDGWRDSLLFSILEQEWNK